MKQFLTIFVLGLAIMISMMPPHLFSQIRHVPSEYSTIQQGIDAANNGDTVLVAEGTYYENLQITSKPITLASHFLVDGDTSHVSRTIIDGSQPQNTDQASVIWVGQSEPATVICGFTITGGYGTRYTIGEEVIRVAGGINAVESSITIRDNRIIHNVISKSRVPDTYGGTSGGGIGIYPLEGQTIIIRNNLIADNYIEGVMPGGGGIAFQSEEKDNNYNYIIENNLIINNINHCLQEWKAMGGGLALPFYLPRTGTQIIRNNVFSNNQARCVSSFGGAMYIIISESIPDGSVDNDPGPYIYNNIFRENHSDHLGGAIAVWRVYWPIGDVRAWPLTSAGHYTPKPSFINNTFVNNTAADGSAFYIMNMKPFLMNNILWDDHPADAPWGEIFLGDEPTWVSWGVDRNIYGGVEMYNSVVQGDRWADIDKGIWNIDPSFADTLYHLSETSPGIGTGRPLVELNGITYQAPEDDIEGNDRPHSTDSFIDLGAYESPYLAQARPLSLTIPTAGFYINPYQVSPAVTTEVVNPHGENLKVYAHLQIPDSAEVMTTAELHDDGLHNDEQAGDHIYGGAFDPFNNETMLNLFLSMENLSRGTTMVFHDSNRFTSVGPVVLESVRNVSTDTVVHAGDYLKFKFTLKNNSSTATAFNLSSRVVALDTFALIKMSVISGYGDLAAGASYESGAAQYIRFNKNGAGQTACFALKIYSNDYNFWTDTFYVDIIPTGIEEFGDVMIKDFALFQNHPNPFNPRTVISYQVRASSGSPVQVELSIYNLLGQKVATLVSEKQPAGTYEVQWDATGFASGVYLYKLHTDNGFSQTRKLVLLR